MIEAMMGSQGYAVVHMTGTVGAASIVLPVAHAFDTPDGFALITPAYIDPVFAGQNHMHRIVAKVAPDGTFEGPEWSGWIELYEPTAQQLTDTDYALEWYGDQLEDKGITVEEERARLRAELLSEVSARAA